jgi:hypothetical protein
MVEADANGGNIVQTRAVKIDWNFPGNASGCGTEWGYSCTGNQNSFTMQISGGSVNQTFSFPSTARTFTTGNILTSNANYTIQICAKNGAMTTCTSMTKAKVAYPVGHVTGNFLERDTDTNACYVGIRGLPIMNLNVTNNANISTACTATPGAASGTYTGYDCTITLDNINADPAPQGHVVSFNTIPSSALYTGAGQCGGAGGAGVCAAGLGSCANLFTANFDQNQPGLLTSGTKSAYFSINNNLSFYKLKNASYYHTGSITSLFPVNHQSFDADDTPLVGYFNRGTNGGSNNGVGAVMSSGAQQVGAAGAANNGVSAPGWSNEGYTAASRNTAATRFTDYVKGRKDYTTINSLGDAAFTSRTSGIFLVQGNLTINAAAAGNLSNKQVVVIATGTINITGNVIPANSSAALIAPNIYISETVSEVHGLIVGNSVSIVSQGFGGTSTTPLKIYGNLSAGNPINVASRVRTDSFKPSFFVVQDSNMYAALLSSISETKYDWKQLQ